MHVKDLTDANFDSETEWKSLILIDFWAEWCAPCKAFAPIFEAAAKNHPDVLFAKVNTETEPTLAQQFEVRSIPTLLAVKDGEIAAVRVGALPPSKLEELIRELRHTSLK